MNKLLIWDLDGTLIDTREGIFNSIRCVEKKMCLPSKSVKELEGFLGPPIKESYKKIYKLSGQDITTAVKYHIEYGISNAVYESFVYDGIFEILNNLNNCGVDMYVATMKPACVAKKMLSYHNMRSYFKAVMGQCDEFKTKTDEIVAILKDNEYKNDEVFLIGDTISDADAAQKTNVNFVRVLYGYGFKSESEINDYPSIVDISCVADFEKVLTL